MKTSRTPHLPRHARNRNRASVACTSCRVTRVKCSIQAGQRICDPCHRSGTECIIRDDDKRKRLATQVQQNSLLQRVENLESVLKQPNRSTLSATVTVATPQFAESPDHHMQLVLPDGESNTSNYSDAKIQEFVIPSIHSGLGNANGQFTVVESALSASVTPQTKPAGARTSQVRKNILSPFNLLHVNSPCGRIQYFGSTTNMHTLFDGGDVLRHQRGEENNWRIEMLLPEVSSETLQYLTNRFWKFHNSTIHLVHKDAFYEDKKNGRSQFYSTFLHFSILAMGFRYAEKTRNDIQRLSLLDHESTLHKKALKMAEYELKRPGGIPSVQALFLLGDLECGCGRDDTGWMYGGMSLRLAFDIGLHFSQSQLDAKERDICIRHMVMWACIINDKYWSLFLGRPTVVMSDTIVTAKESKKFDRLIACRSNIARKSLETKVYEALIVLMDIAGAITDVLDHKEIQSNNEIYFRMAALDRDLTNWYSNLPQYLKWSPNNISIAPSSFFLLHQQYHTASILLHRPFADYGQSELLTSMAPPIDHVSQVSMLSRNICLQHAILVASIFTEYQKRFNVEHTFVTALQHAGTAATALIAEISATEGTLSRKDLMEHLVCLYEVLTAMAKTYKPAERMSAIVLYFMKDHGFTEDAVTVQSAVALPLQPEKRDQLGSPLPFNQYAGYAFREQELSFPDYTSLGMDISSVPEVYATENDFMYFPDSFDQIGVGLDFLESSAAIQDTGGDC